MNRWEPPGTLEKAYELRDTSVEPERRDFYQEHVYRLRARQYRARGIVTEESILRRQKYRAKARSRPAGVKDERRGWWKKVRDLAGAMRLWSFGRRDTAGRPARELEE